MARQIDLFILAGEPSADLQGAALIQELLKLDPTLNISAVAGPRMRQFPITCVEPMESLQVMGFIDVLLALPRMVKLFYSLRRKILEASPKVFVGIDYPGFNLRMHKALNRKKWTGKLVQYICPTVWAWGKKRIPLMARNLDLLLTILPFEPELFKQTPLRAEYVGHPLIEKVSKFAPTRDFRKRYGFSESDKILALFPGSRKQEVERNWALMMNAAERLKKRDPSLRVAISAAHEKTFALETDAPIVPAEETYDLMRNAHLALAKSGTVALELALHKTPTVVQYAIKPLDVFLATKIFKIKLPYYSLPNLILQKEVFPELFGPNLSETSLYERAEALWFDEQKRQECRAGLEDLWHALGEQPASRIAAEKIVQFVLDNH